jgi:hypothetical protein
VDTRYNHGKGGEKEHHVTETIQSDICIPNIGPKERRRRLHGGLLALVIAVVIAIVLLATGADRWWRLALFPFFYGGMSGVFQWREKT